MAADAPMPVSHIHHVGIVVMEIDRSLVFYRDVLGFEVVERVELVAGKEVSAGVGFPTVQLKIAHLRGLSEFLKSDSS